MARGMSRTLQRAAERDFGPQAGKSGLSRRIEGNGAGNYRIVLTFNAMPISVTKALSYASQKLVDFPAGRLQIDGGTASLAFAVTSARVSTINDNAVLSWGLGTAAASSVTLATTMVNVVPQTNKTLDGAVAAYTTPSNVNAAAVAVYDGTTTPVDVYLNVAFPTATDIDADGTLAVNGTITLIASLFGDY